MASKSVLTVMAMVLGALASGSDRQWHEVSAKMNSSPSRSSDSVDLLALVGLRPYS